MERELISQRVRAGLANARAQGKQIGRKKTRPSQVIRALLKQKMTFREIAKIAGCSHGCISAEKKEMLKEEAEKADLDGINSNKDAIKLDKDEVPKLTLV